jgi:3-oxoacyl-[acyl-carrier-protein] synthase-3
VTTYAAITGWGRSVPERVLTNFDLEKLVDTSDEWIRTRTGISERRIVGDDEATSDLAIRAAREALAAAGIDPSDLELIIVATCTPDWLFPSVAARVQHALGARRAAAFDLNAACSGFIFALATATQFIRAGSYRRALVVGSEVLSRVVDWTDRKTCVLFGDGAGAVVLEATDKPLGLLSYVLGTDGSGDQLLYLLGPTASPKQRARAATTYLYMNGPEVFKFAVNVTVAASRQVLEGAGLTLEDVALFVPHQANERIIRAAAKSLHLPPEKVYINLDRFGNTSAASIPMALAEAVERGRLQAGDLVLMVGFGAGLTWAAGLVRWGGPNGSGGS